MQENAELIEWSHQQVRLILTMGPKELIQAQKSVVEQPDSGDDFTEIKAMITLGLITCRLMAVQELQPIKPIIEIPSVFKDLF